MKLKLYSYILFLFIFTVSFCFLHLYFQHKCSSKSLNYMGNPAVDYGSPDTFLLINAQ